jgi:hypothetical protein
MNTAVRLVKMNAWIKATRISIRYMNTENAIEIGENPHPIAALSPPKININEIRQMMMICPASIFANNLMISANGFVNTERTSTSIRMGFIPPGTGGLNICPQ